MLAKLLPFINLMAKFFFNLDVDKKPIEPVRAWVISKTDILLHILVFCQHSDSSGVVNEDEIKVELLSHGCDPDTAPNLVAAFGLNGAFHWSSLQDFRSIWVYICNAMHFKSYKCKIFSHLGKEVIINKIPEHSRVENMTYGLAVNIILRDYSTFYSYKLQSVVGGIRKTILKMMPSGTLRLKDELEGMILGGFINSYPCKWSDVSCYCEKFHICFS